MKSRDHEQELIAKELDLIRQHKHWLLFGYRSLEAYLRAELGLALQDLES